MIEFSRETFSELLKIVSHHLRDLKSIRITLIWLYSIVFLFLVIYSTLKYENVASTSITATASLVGVIFSGYIYSKTHASKNTNQKDNNLDN